MIECSIQQAKEVKHCTRRRNVDDDILSSSVFAGVHELKLQSVTAVCSGLCGSCC